MNTKIALIALIALISCATPYQMVGTSVAGGYSSTQVAQDQFEIDFRGNGFTAPKLAYDFALLRAAEVSLEHNYPFFTLIGHKDLSRTEIIPGTTTTFTNGTVNSTGGYGTFTGTTTTYNTDTPVTKPAVALLIRCLESRDAIGPHGGKVFSAQEVRNELRKKYNLDTSK